MEGFVTALVWLYPRSFRERYGREIKEIVLADVVEVKGPWRKLGRGIRSAAAALPWVIHEHVDTFIEDYGRTPTAVKVEYIVNFALVMPFFLIVAHNELQREVWHQVSPLFQTIGTAWIGYSIFLPSLALMSSLLGMIWFIRQKHRPHGGLALPVLTALLAIAAIM